MRKLLAVLLIAVACLSCKGNGVPEASAGPAGADDARLIHCLGRLVPGERVIRVAAPPHSRVKQILVKRGDWVEAGQILAILHDHDAAKAALTHAAAERAVAEGLLAQVRAGTKPAELAAQQAVVARWEAELKTAETERRRRKELYESKALPLSELDAVELRAARARQHLREAEQRLTASSEVREVDVTVAERKVAAAEAAEAKAAAELEQQIVRAPLAAEVLQINTYPGEAVSSAGVLDLADTRSMAVEAEVYITDLPRVVLGAHAAVSGDGLRGTLAARVSEILRGIETNSIYESDPYSYSDRRIVKVRLALLDGAPASGLVNSQVNVTIAAK